MISYYVARNENGKALALVKIDDDNMAYAWINGAWDERPSLLKIKFDVTTNYNEISESEANRLIERGEV